MTEEPRALTPRLVELWNAHHDDRPVLVIRCASERSCRLTLGRLWATSDGLLLHYFQHVAPRRFEVDTTTLTDEQVRAHIARPHSGLRRYEPGAATGISRGLRDEVGSLAMLDVEAWWQPAEAGCSRHEGLIELDRQQMLDAAHAAARRGSQATLSVSAH